MNVFLASDHRGYELKEKLEKILGEKECCLVDLTPLHDPEDDYPDVAGLLAMTVKEDLSNNARGILLCGSGAGVTVGANRFRAIRATLGLNKEQVQAARNDDDVNVLVIAADYTDEKEAEAMSRVFLETAFAEEERFLRRRELLDTLGP